ncbi:Unknown protein, partial [Striga hermonthica]
EKRLHPAEHSGAYCQSVAGELYAQSKSQSPQRGDEAAIPLSRKRWQEMSSSPEGNPDYVSEHAKEQHHECCHEINGWTIQWAKWAAALDHLLEGRRHLKGQDPRENVDAMIASLKKETAKVEADMKGKNSEQVAQLEVAQAEISALSEEKKAFQTKVAELKEGLAFAEQHSKALEAKVEEVEEKLLQEKTEHDTTRKECSEVHELVGRQRDAHQAEMAKLEKEKSEYGEFMYENGFQARKDSVPEVTAVQVGVEEAADGVDTDVGEVGPNLELEMNTCLTLR